MNWQDTQQASGDEWNGDRDWNGPLRCEDIREVLPDYVTRSLGGSRSELVREHLRQCADCRAEAAEMHKMLELLREARQTEGGGPRHLSKDRHDRVIRALMHPVISWIERHHILVSAVVTVLLIALLLIFLRGLKIWKSEPETRVEVRILPRQDVPEEAP